jgi:uncharacterized protein YuzE
MEQRLINSGKMVAASLVDLAKYGQDKLFVDYDEEADVLYVSFGKPQKADNAVQEDGIIRRFRGKKIIGLTILNASQIKKSN